MQTQRDEGLGAGGAWERPKLSLQGPNSREWTSPSSQTETETQLKTPELTHFSSVLKTTQVPRPNNWNGEGKLSGAGGGGCEGVFWNRTEETIGREG